MKRIFIAFIFFLAINAVYAQRNHADSLIAKIESTDDPRQIEALLGQLERFDDNFALLKKGKADLARFVNSTRPQKEERALLMICRAAFILHDSPVLLETALRGIRISRDAKDTMYLDYFLHGAGLSYIYERDYRNSANYFIAAGQTALAGKDTADAIFDFSNLETSYVHLKKLDSARFITKRDISLANRLPVPEKWHPLYISMGDMGEVLTNMGRLDSALVYYHQAYEIAKRQVQSPEVSYLENNMAKTFMQTAQPDSALKYELDAYRRANATKIWEFITNAAGTLSKLYEGRDDKKSIFYLKEQVAANDSATANEKSRNFQLIADRDQQREQDLKNTTAAYRANIRFYGVIAVLAVVGIIVVLLLIAYRRQQTVNRLLQSQKKRTEEAMQKLLSTQQQLIQSEKMASLGELTAGIAHEIQNPLNFVNNFSEVSVELLGELKEQAQAGNNEDVISIASDLSQNLEKINHHGKRAGFIVKGMLQHSRTNTGERQLTNINVLAEEFLKLSYQGLRAKDKNFNAEMVTYFGPDLPVVNVARQDIGRVLVNLFNNAFYAVNQKSKTSGAGYKPEVSVTTSTENGQVIIKVKDNGIGIPDAIKDKIMQPFFTTKPTGEGTGLGLSLTYDMVVNGHGGKLTVDTKEGEFTEFKISIPK
jgi:two-component system NtrC family sensor kinase